MEAVLLSVSPSFTAQLEGSKPKLGMHLRRLKDKVDKPLAAILSLNTIAHTVGAAGAGAQAAFVFGDAYVGVISAVLTFLILVLSEIIPKTLGAIYWRQLTPLVVSILIPIIWIMWPFVKMAEGLMYLMTRGKRKKLIQRDEFIALTELGIAQGVFHKDESRILQNLFKFRQVYTSDIMTPRTVIFTLPAKEKISDIVKMHPHMKFSRIPLYGENQDDIRGFVLKADILQHAVNGKDDLAVSELMRKMTVVTKDLSLRDLFSLMMSERSHIALVVDEYGGTAGLVTMEDLIETLLGVEIVDEADTESDMQELARKVWLKRARELGIVTGESDVER
jgi:CBS domain containing-hemolysin-like protein